jgi:hypothetical protein
VKEVEVQPLTCASPLTPRPSPFDYVERHYRTFEGRAERWVPFRAAVETTDLYLLAERDLSDEALAAAGRARRILTDHIAGRPEFATALRPLDEPTGLFDDLLRSMYGAGRAAGVGPMAAVAGAVAEHVGRELRELSREVVVENGGDLYLDLAEEATVGLFAGPSPFSGRLGLRIAADRTPLGVCTSSGSVGPSLSFGVADAATVLSRDAALADAVATGVGNRVQGPEDLEAAVAWALTLPGVVGALAVLGDRMAVQGEVEFVRVGS